MAGKIAIEDYATLAARNGGYARAAELSATKRMAIAKKAARARWPVSRNRKHYEQFATKPPVSGSPEQILPQGDQQYHHHGHSHERERDRAPCSRYHVREFTLPSREVTECKEDGTGLPHLEHFFKPKVRPSKG